MRGVAGLGIAMFLAAAALAAPASPGADVEIAYGGDPLQRLDFYRLRAAKPPPLLVFLHGGGWARGDKRGATGQKPAFFAGQGYALASLNYRLVPDATVADQARDVAAAIAMLRRDAARLGFDPDRIVIAGHSAGAHLAALVATDPAYLTARGVPIKALRGAILLDGAGYDVARQLNGAGPLVRRIYTRAFGADPRFHASVSPLTHAAAPNAPAFLIVHDADRLDAKGQSEALAAALRKAGARVALEAVPDTSHAEINRRLGDLDYAATRAAASFLRSLD